MNHQFDVNDAIRYGVDEAIILSNIRFWIAKNKANNKHCYDGRYWTYNSARAFAELFPYWNEQKIQKMLKKLENNGVILATSEYNETAYDRTKWYSIVNESTNQNESTDSSKMMNEKIKNDDSTVTDINTDINTDSVCDEKSRESKEKNTHTQTKFVLHSEYELKLDNEKLAHAARLSGFDLNKIDEEKLNRAISAYVEKNSGKIFNDEISMLRGFVSRYLTVANSERKKTFETAHEKLKRENDEVLRQFNEQREKERAYEAKDITDSFKQPAFEIL